MSNQEKLWLPLGVKMSQYLSHQKQPTDTVRQPPEQLKKELALYLLDRGLAPESKIDPIKAASFSNIIQEETLNSSIRAGISLSDSIAISKAYSISESPELTPLVKSFATRIESNIRNCGCRLPGDIIIEVAESGEFTGEVAKLDSGYAIVIHKGLMIGIHAAVKIFCWSWNFRDLTTGADEEPSWSPRDTSLALAHLASAHWQLSVIASPRYRMPSGNRLYWLEHIVDRAEEFAIAHEYAHIMNDDLEIDGTNAPIDPVSDFKRAQLLEYCADATALHLVLSNANWSGNVEGGRYDTLMICWGMITLFGVTHLFQSIGDKVFSRPANPFHPKPVDRLTRLDEVLRRKLDEPLHDMVRNAATWWEAYTDDVLENVSWHKLMSS